MAEKRRPIHIGIAVGVSASMYAVSLAAVTALQSQQDAQIGSGYAPLAEAADRLDATNAGLEARMDAARAAFDASATAFSDLAGRVPGFETRLEALASTIAKLHGSTVSLSIPSGGGSIPGVAGSRPVAAKPPVHTTTSASGH
jgi:hypothetical protein